MTSKIISPLIAPRSAEVILNQLACVVVQAYNVSGSTGLRLREWYRHGMESVCVQLASRMRIRISETQEGSEEEALDIPKHG